LNGFFRCETFGLMSYNFLDHADESPAKPAERPSALSAFVADASEFVGNAVVQPMVNTAILEPVHAAARLVDSAAGAVGYKTELGEATKPFELHEAVPYSGEWYVQSVASGLGSLVPYTIAGKTAGAALRNTGARLAIEGAAATLMKNEHVAFVAGAFAYDGLRATRPGETHLGNALGGAAGFIGFGASNSIAARMTNTGDRLAIRAIGGMAGADLHAVVSTAVAQNRWLTKEEAFSAAISGGTMNILLPTVQNAITKAAVGFSSKRNGAWADQYLKVAGHDHEVAQSPEMQQVLANNPWAKVKVGVDQINFDKTNNRVELPLARRDISVIGRELAHLGMGRAEEPGFQLAAQLLSSGKTEAAWEAFKQQRATQETGAHTSQHKINRDLNGQEVLSPDNLIREMGAWPAPNGVSYEQRWRQEFHQFQQTGGAWRPGTAPVTTEAYLPESARPLKTKPDHELTVDERKALSDRQVATELIKDLQKEGYIAVLAGGAVRDEAMGLIPHDYDIATSAPPDVVHGLFAQRKGMDVDAVGKQFGIINLRVDADTQFQIASLRNDGNYTDGRRPDYVRFVASLYEDGARRDLTINAMFSDPVTQTTYDFFGGLPDIAQKKIRTVGDASHRFNEDKLRMMRIPRFISRFEGFTVAPETAEAVTKHAPEINAVAPERVMQEFKTLMLTRNPGVGLDFMMDHGLMQATMPELAALRGPKAMQDPVWHPEGSTWNHSRMVLDKIVEMGPAPGRSKYELRMGGLFHDAGKPDTQRIWPDGGVSNHGHAAVGAKMFRQLGLRLKMPNSEINHIATLIDRHMDMHAVEAMRPSTLIPILEHPLFEDMRALQHADAMGTGRSDGITKSKFQFLGDKRQQFTEAVDPAQRLHAKPLVDGALLISMGMKPSARLGEVKTAALDAQRNGKITDAQTAQQWLLAQYKELRPPSL
jgi:putative nucleotidyltransferase with HDIG domain